MYDHYKLVFTTSNSEVDINMNVYKPNKNLTGDSINTVMNEIVNSGIVCRNNATITGKKSAKLNEYTSTTYSL